jgi:hypothetical protein
MNKSEAVRADKRKEENDAEGPCAQLTCHRSNIRPTLI